MTSLLLGQVIEVSDGPGGSFGRPAGVAIDFDSTTGLAATWTPALVPGLVYTVDEISLFEGAEGTGNTPVYLGVYSNFNSTNYDLSGFLGASENAINWADISSGGAMTWTFSGIEVTPETNPGTGNDILFFVIQPTREAILKAPTTIEGEYPVQRINRETGSFSNHLSAIVHGNGINGIQLNRAPEYRAKLTIMLGEDDDGDQLPDSWEELYAPGNPSALTGLLSGPGPGAGTGDFDGDGLSDSQELFLGTNPTLADTDGDGFSDLVETNTGVWVSATDTGTKPTVADTDGDGLRDGDENPDSGEIATAPYRSNPNLRDTDGDFFGDDYEVLRGTNPSDSASIPVQSGGFQLIENFDGPGMMVGETFAGINDWRTNSPDNAVVELESEGSSNQVGLIRRSGASTTISKGLDRLGLPVLEGNQGTLFFQLKANSNQINLSGGLSDVLFPNFAAFGEFEAQVVAFRNSVVRVRDAGAFRDVGNYPADEWLNIWLFADNQSDTVRLFASSTLDPEDVAEFTDDGGVNPFNFRNGTTEALSSLLMIFALDADLESSASVDNFYLDPVALNLTTPPGVIGSPAIEVPVITAVRFVGGDLKVTFEPGGDGFFLSSSADLEAPFVEETNALFDGDKTFTILAADVPPASFFYRIEKRQ